MNSHLKHDPMPCAGIIRFVEVEASHAQKYAPYQFRPIAFARIVSVPFIARGQCVHDAQRILQRVPELLVEEVLERFCALVENSHVCESAVQKRIHMLMLCFHIFQITSNAVHLRVMRLADRKNNLRYVENRRRQIVKQPKEHRIPPAIPDLHVWHPNDRVARMHMRILVHQIAEFRQRQRIRFARRAMYHLGRLHRTRAHIPAHRDRCVDDIVARNDVDQ